MFNSEEKRIAIAPMMDWSDRHYRHFIRLLSPHVWVYTEMITTGAILHGDRDRFLQFNETEHPVALQLGGNEPAQLALCSQIGADYGYDEINLNIGCPSDRVQCGGFGAYLMAYPELVAKCVAAMQAKVNIPITVKTRIGIDEQDSYEALCHFIQVVAQAGCKTFIIHARKAWLKGLSPKQNREIPPLRYEIVYQLKQDFPDLTILLNGGIQTVQAIESHLIKVDGVMIGREAYYHPYIVAEIEQAIFKGKSLPNRDELIRAMVPYLEAQQAKGVPIQSMTRHLLGLYHQQPGARQFRRYLSEHAHRAVSARELLLGAIR